MEYRGYTIETIKFTGSGYFYGHIREIGRDTADTSSRSRAVTLAKQIIDNQPENIKEDRVNQYIGKAGMTRVDAEKLVYGYSIQ